MKEGESYCEYSNRMFGPEIYLPPYVNKLVEIDRRLDEIDKKLLQILKGGPNDRRT